MPAHRTKPASALAYKRGGRGNVAVLPPAPVVVPEAPEFVGDYAMEVWDAFWTTPVSGAVDMARDGERLRHWIWCVHSRETVRKQLEQTPLATGSMEQIIRHPLWDVWAKLSREIEVAEQHFGMTPLAKMRLTGALDSAEHAEEQIEKRRERKMKALPLEARKKA